jgi:hypothetical protein
MNICIFIAEWRQRTYIILWKMWLLNKRFAGYSNVQWINQIKGKQGK